MIYVEFEYAFHAGVPMAVLTDGQEWNFYLPSGKGSYEERRFYKIDILEREIEEIVKCFILYLSFEKVCSGESIKAAHDDYENVTKDRQVNEYLPKAWQKLVEEQDITLMDLVSEEVADLCGYKPATDTVAMFLTQLTMIGPTDQHTAIMEKTGVEPYPPPINPSNKFIFNLKGQKYEANSAIDVLIKVLEKLSSLDPTFLTRFASRKHGRNRRYIAKTKDELYPGRKDLASNPNMSSQLSSGWFVGKNYNQDSIEKIIKMACEVAGISFGHDLIIFFRK